MSPFQGKIYLKNNIIDKMIEEQGFVEIISDTEKTHFDNSWAYPGFVDSHGHLIGLVNKLTGLNLYGLQSLDECLENAKKHHYDIDGWISGNGWNHELWDEKTYPDKSSLDKIFPETPVFLMRVDGHAAWVNSKALEIAGIDRNTPEIDGGIIIRDSVNNPTGILVDEAMFLVSRNIPKPSTAHLEKMILLACNDLASKGITEVHDMDVHPEYIPLFRKLDEQKLLPIRIQSYVGSQENQWQEHGIFPHRGTKFNIIGIKFYADGALGSRGAAMLEAYSDDSSATGLFWKKPAALYDDIKRGLENGWQIAVHAIGDAANHEVLKVFAKLYEQHSHRKPVFRLEHAQHIAEADMQIFDKCPVIASVQPIHCISDAPMTEKRIEARTKEAYRWKTLLERNVVLLGGSDFPIESHDPLIGIYAFTARIPFERNEAWHPEEIISIQDALQIYTRNPHIISGNEEKLGTLEPGKFADITVLNRDIITCSAQEILETKVISTVSEGKIIYRDHNHG